MKLDLCAPKPVHVTLLLFIPGLLLTYAILNPLLPGVHVNHNLTGKETEVK